MVEIQGQLISQLEKAVLNGAELFIHEKGGANYKVTLDEMKEYILKGMATINGQTITGGGNIEISGGGSSSSGIGDVSDSKKYVRSNGVWVDIDTLNFATKSELGEINRVLDTINGEVI